MPPDPVALQLTATGLSYPPQSPRGAPGSHPQDAAAGASPTWPPAPGAMEKPTAPEDLSSSTPPKGGTPPAGPREGLGGEGTPLASVHLRLARPQGAV